MSWLRAMEGGRKCQTDVGPEREEDEETARRRKGSEKTMIAVDVCKGVTENSREGERDRGRSGRERNERLARGLYTKIIIQETSVLCSRHESSEQPNELGRIIQTNTLSLQPHLSTNLQQKTCPHL